MKTSWAGGIRQISVPAGVDRLKGWVLMILVVADIVDVEAKAGERVRVRRGRRDRRRG